MCAMGSPGTWEVSFSPVEAAARAPLEKWSRPAETAALCRSERSSNDGYGAVKATKPSRMEGETSESADGTGEGGEPTRRDPLEGSGRPD